MQEGATGTDTLAAAVVAAAWNYSGYFSTAVADSVVVAVAS